MHKKQIRPIARLHGYWLYKNFLSQTGRWPLARRRAFVFEKLKQTLVRAYEGTPFYRDRFRQAGFDPRRDFQSVSDLAALPLLTKQDIREHSEEMMDRRFLTGSVIANTSGTTGQPTAMRLSEYYVAFDYACMYRHWAKAGYAFRGRFAAIRSYVPSSADQPHWKYNYWQNTLYMSAYHLRPANAERYVEELLRFQPHYIRGYASSVNVLAEYARPFRDKLSFVRGVFTASETLLPTERSNIEQTFGKKLFDWYGMTEPAVVITERADHDGMEVDWEYGYPEFLEEPDLSPQQRKLIATSLHNPAMPFIRYETGDIVNLADDPPHADQVYPRVRSISGRKDECILTRDGGRLPSLNFYSLLQTRAEILRFQVVQPDLDHVVMKVSLRPGTPNPDALFADLKQEVERRLGPKLSLSIEATDDFLCSADGKTPTFKRLFASRPADSPKLMGKAGGP